MSSNSVEVGDNLIRYEKKAWKVDNIDKLLPKSIKSKFAADDDFAEDTGQLFKDLVQLKADKELCCTRWSFDARAADYPGGAAAIRDKIAKLAEDNQEALMAGMGLKNELKADSDAFIKFIEQLKQTDFVEISAKIE
ncbi:hypothetical protein [Shewanella xiamenensis]|uniref:hypothetical protein n=1 Tax=Shewanella xiamenensis TaxID=332186 RepID=UPI0035B6D0CA